MKKLVFLLCFVSAIFTTERVNAQLDFQKGDGILNASVGLGNGYYYGPDFYTIIPALAVSYEVGIVDDLIDGNASVGVGGYFGISASRYDPSRYGVNYGTNFTNILIGPRGTFHYQFLEKLDTYAGLLLAASISSVRNYGDYPLGVNNGARSRGPLAFQGFIGARYYFQPNLAAMVEIGHGIAYLNLGVALRLQ